MNMCCVIITIIEFLLSDLTTYLLSLSSTQSNSLRVACRERENVGLEKRCILHAIARCAPAAPRECNVWQIAILRKTLRVVAVETSEILHGLQRTPRDLIM